MPHCCYKADIDINDSCNEHQQNPLHLAIKINIGILPVIALNKMHILISKRVLLTLTLRTPFENIMKFMIKHKKNKNTKEYLDAMEMIEYAIEYVKGKLIDQNIVIKIVNEENYKSLLEEGAAFLLEMIQKQLKEVLIENNLLYWAAGRNIILIKQKI
ncbi:hypothetical protein RFI_39329 [Reticulomyxa filosa]|uniref:Uncharacterized protein n=1 Tax=Reticulomyxa filosa TaxID=46433 RepID=X6L9G9_RETFI|nr:hypothetical protein RFI_39329 [Reticulomyxa filosa]|eukprot:ETN98183.1 hypothetical protein RFI_39329 [Reticulomyxa filosa]